MASVVEQDLRYPTDSERRGRGWGTRRIDGARAIERAFDSEQERLADAVVGALRDYARLPDSERLLRAFNLLGDPALLLPR